MRTQQEAERAEQQRIKNLVLNYDLRDENESDGDNDPPLTPNLNKQQQISTQQQRGGCQRNHRSQNGTTSLAPSRPNNTGSSSVQQNNKNGNVNVYDNTAGGLEKQHNPYNVPRIDKASNNRSTQRARKLQLSDVDWYENTKSQQRNDAAASQTSSKNRGIRKNGQPRKTRG